MDVKPFASIASMCHMKTRLHRVGSLPLATALTTESWLVSSSTWLAHAASSARGESCRSSRRVLSGGRIVSTGETRHLVRFENAALRIDERNGCAIEYKAVSKSACLYSATARGRELGDGVECRLSDLDVQQAKSHNRLAPENC